MSRARLLKPGFFTNDRLAEVAPIGRLLFAGLWTIADREGRLEDRPKRIKAEVLPFDNANVDKLLTDLAERGFITRYESGGNPIIQIQAFLKHQSPHPREVPSRLPAMGQPLASHLPASDENGTGPSVPIAGSSVAVAVTEPVAGSDAGDGLSETDLVVGRLCREWERATSSTVNRAMGDAMEAWLARLPEPAIAKAILQTGLSGKRSWSYTEGILRRYESEGWGEREEKPKPAQHGEFKLRNVWDMMAPIPGETPPEAEDE